MHLKDKIKSLKGVGEKRQSEYSKLKIDTIYDLLTYFPRGYEDTRLIVDLNKLVDEEKGSVRLKILGKKAVRTAKNKIIFKFIGKDHFQNFVELVYFNNRYINDKLKVLGIYFFYGKITKDFYAIK